MKLLSLCLRDTEEHQRRLESQFGIGDVYEVLRI